jgi:hypothetical protein
VEESKPLSAEQRELMKSLELIPGLVNLPQVHAQPGSRMASDRAATTDLDTCRNFVTTIWGHRPITSGRYLY